MKMIFLLALTLSTTAAFADAKVFCKERGKIINVLSQNGLDCQGALYMGEACFTGKAKDAVTILNSEDVREIFIGTDGEYIKDARVKNDNTITYTAVDEANEWSDKRQIKRCLGSWFRN